MAVRKKAQPPDTAPGNVIRLALLEQQQAALELIAEDAPLDQVFERLCLAIEAVIPTSLGSLVLHDTQRGVTKNTASPNLPAAFISAVDGAPVGPKGGCCGTAMYRREFVAAKDILTDPLWTDYREAARAHGLRACWSELVIGRDGVALGSFAIYFRAPCAPLPAERSALSSIARIAGIAIEHGRRADTVGRLTQTLQSLAGHLPAATYTWLVFPDGSTKYEFVSEGIRHISGLTPEQVMADPNSLFNLIPEADRAKALESRRRGARDMGAWENEVRLQSLGGEMKWVHMRARIVLRPDGTQVWQGVMMDITAKRQAEQAVANSDERLRLALDSIEEAFILWDTEDRLVLFNQRALEMYPYLAPALKPGVHYSEVLRLNLEEGGLDPQGRSISTLLAERAEAHHEVIERHFTDGRTYLIQRHRTAGGDYVSISIDITEMRRQESELRQRVTELEEARRHIDEQGKELIRQSFIMQASLDNIEQGVSLYDADERMLLCNRRYREIFAGGQAKVKPGMTLEEAVNLDHSYMGQSAGNTKAVLGKLRRIARSNRRVIKTITRFGRRYECVHQPLPNGWFISTYNDVTDREQAQAALKASEARLRHAIEGIQEGFTLWDPDERLIMFNRRTVEMYPQLEPFLKPGMRYQEVLEANIALSGPNLEESTREAMRTDGLKDRSVTVERKFHDGRVYLFQRRRTSDGDVVALSIDITEVRRGQQELEARLVELEAIRQRLEQQGRELLTLAENLAKARDEAEAANRTKSEFLANMSHELRTPLNAVIGFSEVMLHEMFGPIGNERYRDYARDMHSSGTHLLAIINDILDLSKIEAGRLELREDHVHLEQTIQACITLTADRARESEVTLSLDLPSAPPVVWGDPLKLKQVVLNLVSNAIKFTPPGGSVKVSMEYVPGGDLILRIADTGIGMTADEITVAMQPFRQVDSSLSRRHDGTGLGLPLAHALMALHGGQLAIESKPGQGTIVSLTIPAARIDTQP